MKGKEEKEGFCNWEREMHFLLFFLVDLYFLVGDGWLRRFLEAKRRDVREDIDRREGISGMYRIHCEGMEGNVAQSFHARRSHRDLDAKTCKC